MKEAEGERVEGEEREKNEARSGKRRKRVWARDERAIGIREKEGEKGDRDCGRPLKECTGVGGCRLPEWERRRIGCAKFNEDCQGSQGGYVSMYLYFEDVRGAFTGDSRQSTTICWPCGQNKQQITREVPPPRRLAISQHPRRPSLEVPLPTTFH